MHGLFYFSLIWKRRTLRRFCVGRERNPSSRAELATGQDRDQLKGSKLAKIREKFPNANRPWTKDDDEKLTEMFTSETSHSKIAKEFGRKTGAITARLAKLGLIEDDYWARREKGKKDKW